MEASRSASIASPSTGRPLAAAARRPASAALGVYAKPAAASIPPVDCGAAAAGLRAERRLGVTSCVAGRVQEKGSANVKAERATEISGRLHTYSQAGTALADKLSRHR